MQRQPWSQRIGGKARAVGFDQVFRFAAEGVAALGEMNANLVGTAGLQVTVAQAAPVVLFQHANIGDRDLSFLAGLAAATAIPPVFDEAGFVAALGWISHDKGEVSSKNGMPGELLDQLLAGRGVSGEHQEPAGISIESMNGEQIDGSIAPVADSGSNQVSREFIGCWIGAARCSREPSLFRTPHADDARRFSDDDKLVANVDQFDARWGERRPGRAIADFDLITRAHSPAFIQAGAAIDEDRPPRQRRAPLGPRFSGVEFPEGG